MRANTSEGYTGVENAAEQRDSDRDVIGRNRTSFGSFLQDKLSSGGARDSQLRQLGQLRSLAQGEVGGTENAFRSGVLNPASEQDASTLLNLATQALQGMYSPIAAQAIGRYAGSGDRAFADFARGNVAKVGEMQADTPVENFAQFLGKRFGLF